jgi:hypothetical protein
MQGMPFWFKHKQKLPFQMKTGSKKNDLNHCACLVTPVAKRFSVECDVVTTPALLLEGRKEFVIKTPEASADQSDFPSSIQIIG